MKKQRECTSRKGKDMLVMLAKPPMVFLWLAVVTIGCRSVEEHIPLSAELAIAQVDAYQSVEERELYLKYYSNLESIYQKVREQYSAEELEFFIVFGIYFDNIKGFASKDKYLAVNVKTSKLFHDSKTKFDKRTSQIFFRCIKPLLKIIAGEKELLDDPLIVGVALGVRWQVIKLLLGTYEGEVFEQLQLIVLKDDLNRHLSGELTDQQLLNGSSIFILSEEGRSQKITIKLE